jgi:ssDNA-binding Zn-finger/Zn-ribbon topoisomerase 1
MVEDIGLDEVEPTYPGKRDDLLCAECGASMVLRPSKYGLFYGCTKFPECRGTHGAHADGRPKGTPGNAVTKKARIEAHRIFDQIWKSGLVKNRGAAYKWMQKAMGISRSEAHIGEFSIKQCEKLMRLVYQNYPKLRGSRWTALIVDPLDD